MSKLIGQTIWEQMKTIDMNLIWCMGTRKLTLIDNGIQFEVSGRQFKGVVQVTLNGKDLYDVKLLKPSKKQDPALKAHGVKAFKTTLALHKEFNDVYVDELMEVLENSVEKRK